MDKDTTNEDTPTSVETEVDPVAVPAAVFSDDLMMGTFVFGQAGTESAPAKTQAKEK